MFAVIGMLPNVCFAQSTWEPFNGIWANGSCTEPKYTFIIAEGLYLYVNEKGAQLAQPDEIRQRGNLLLTRWPVREGKVPITYIWVDGQAYHYSRRIFAGSEVPKLSELPAFPPSEWEIGERPRCPKVKTDLTFIHAEGLAFMNIYKNISITIVPII